jgi:hypothetical protein
MNTLSVINLMPSGKDQVATFVRSIKSEILSGDKKVLPILVQLKYLEKTIDEILKDKEIDEAFLNEYHGYSSKEVVSINGAEVSEGNFGTKYDYRASGDTVWNDLDKQITELTEKRKTREKFLIQIPDEGTVDPGTGLYITRPPESSVTKCTVKIK